MPIFQKSIVDKYLDTLDAGVLDKAYDSYKEVYSAQKIQRIKKLKEEQYQGGFLKDIFGSVLGYTIDPEVGYNLELEKKNETNAKKADGAILQDEKVLGVIELKSNTTKNLESIKDQAFGYKNNHKGCKYVISSNFHKLRFYVDDATEYEEFDLYNLDKETFKKFYLYLRKEGLLDKNIPKLLKEETKFHEENISKQLYKDYSTFKNKFFENIVKNNPHHDKLLLFKKSQKFLDRILFVLFAEDKELIPTNAISRIVESWALADDLHYKPLYELFTILFEHLNVGHIYKSGYEIPAYNGGLFAPDAILDDLKVDDEILKDDLLTLSKYDFNTDVDVNILGHIFEHSLSEIEEIEAELKGEVADKSKGKRKKDGVFYTPKYITKYIVDNTVGKLCSEKKEVLGLDIDFDVQDYQKSNGSVNAKGKELFHTLESYKEWLLSLKILDPACGSGAFLNQALTFLIEEHKNVDDLISELTNTPLRLFDTDKAILENNIFGVDINDESVEIAKLSLWLRTAQKGRKLSNLNDNIKCGNSLIDDPAVAGDKAFKWEEEFSEIFANGGFDVVIGNPPYVRQELVKEYSEELKKYDVFSGKGDLYTYFYEKGCKLLKDKGYLSFISSGKFFEASYGKPLIDFLVNNIVIDEVINFDDLDVFEGISAYPLIFSGRKEVSSTNYRFKHCFVPDYNFTSISEIVSNLPFKDIYIDDFKTFDYNFYDRKTANLISKLNTDSIYLKDLNCLPLVGVKTGFNDGFTVKDKWNYAKPYVFGKNLKKYQPPVSDTNIIFPYKRENNEYMLIDATDLSQEKEHLEDKRSKLESRAIIKDGIINGSKVWFEYQQVNKKLDFDLDYIVYPNVSLGANFTISKGNVIDMTGFIIPSNDKFLLALLNSKICEFVMSKIAITRRGGYQEYKVQYLEKVPLKNVSDIVRDDFSKMTDDRTKLTESHYNLKHTYQKYIETQYHLGKLSRNLQNWHTLEFEEFIKELNKAIKKVGGNKLTKMHEMEWMEVFETKKEEAQTLQAEIDKTDKEIDKMVYELYDLSKEEIQIIENN